MAAWSMLMSPSPIWAAASLALLFVVHKRLCRRMNRADRFLSQLALRVQSARGTPPFGDGLKAPDLCWRDHLVAGFGPAEMLGELCGIMDMPRDQGSSLTLEQATEAVRRMLFFLDPLKQSEGTSYWSEHDCRSIAESLLGECGMSLRSGDQVLQPPPLPPVGPVPFWMELTQTWVNGVAGVLMNLIGFRSWYADTGNSTIHCYDSSQTPLGGDPVPMVLVHGMFTTGISMGAVAALLQRRRRVIVLDLPGFDYGYSSVHGKHKEARAARPGGFEDHVAAVVWLVRCLAMEGSAVQVDVVGHSYGGGVAAEAAKRASKDVRHLHLICPAGVGATRMIGGGQRQGMSKAPSVTTSILMPIINGIFRSPNAVNFYASRAGTTRQVYRGDPWPHVSNVIFAEKDSLVVARETKSVAALFPNGEGHVFKGAVHQMQIFNTRSLCEQMEEFSTRHGGGGNEALVPFRCKVLQAVLAWTGARREVIFNNLD